MYPEAFLEYIWSRKLFLNPLNTDDGVQIHIISYGSKNKFEGPDYLRAIIKINDTETVSDMELDVEKVNWIRHGHHNSKLYQNTYLQIYLDASKKTIK